MNAHESRAWRILVEFGATEVELGGKPALDVSTCHVRTRSERAQMLDAYLNVAGRSGTVRRHVDRYGRAVFVVRDLEVKP